MTSEQLRAAAGWLLWVGDAGPKPAVEGATWNGWRAAEEAECCALAAGLSVLADGLDEEERARESWAVEQLGHQVMRDGGMR